MPSSIEVQTGGVAGTDVRVIKTTHCAVSVQGVSDHEVTDLKIVTAGGIVPMQHGLVIAIFHQYAHLGTGKTIHSSIQLEEFGLQVDEKSSRVPGGLQRIKLQMVVCTQSESRMDCPTYPSGRTLTWSGRPYHTLSGHVILTGIPPSLTMSLMKAVSSGMMP